jgi:hypothetical protein
MRADLGSLSAAADGRWQISAAARGGGQQAVGTGRHNGAGDANGARQRWVRQDPEHHDIGCVLHSSPRRTDEERPFVMYSYGLCSRLNKRPRLFVGVY